MVRENAEGPDLLPTPTPPHPISPPFPYSGLDGGWKPPPSVSDQRGCETWFLGSETFPASLTHMLMFGVHAHLPTSIHKETAEKSEKCFLD